MTLRACYILQNVAQTYADMVWQLCGNCAEHGVDKMWKLYGQSADATWKLYGNFVDTCDTCVETMRKLCGHMCGKYAETLWTHVWKNVEIRAKV